MKSFITETLKRQILVAPMKLSATRWGFKTVIRENHLISLVGTQTLTNSTHAGVTILS